MSAEAYAYPYKSLALVDSGTSCLHLPPDLTDFLISKLLKYVETYSYDRAGGWGYIFECSEIFNLPALDIMIDGVWLEIFVDDYVQFLGNSCAFCI